MSDRRGAGASSSYLLLLPVLVLVCGVFLAGLALAAVQSLGYLPALGLTRLTLDHYRSALADPAFLDSLRLTLRVAALSSLGAFAVGNALAVCLAQVGRAPAWQRFFMQAPLALPHLVAGYMILVLLTPGGLAALAYDRFGWGIVIAYIFKEAPFAAVLVYPLLGESTRRLQEAAATLGASRWQAFRHVVWPLVWPGVLTAGLIIFAFTAGAFEIPYVVGRTYPRALPVLAYQKFTSIDLADRPEAMALAVLLTAIAGAAAGAYFWASRAAHRTLAQVRGARDD